MHGTALTKFHENRSEPRSEGRHSTATAQVAPQVSLIGLIAWGLPPLVLVGMLIAQSF